MAHRRKYTALKIIIAGLVIALSGAVLASFSNATVELIGAIMIIGGVVLAAVAAFLKYGYI